ncbi:hypothetical protein F4556_006929 [Kitasatospora gansuensis]|uniref:Metalloprotease n=1 Tax=Kitasatospora gansuensis TaxID=258050 RepID=A0A7W7SJ18_9ACTN|nr:metalloprotease [Kitasatospora gansuensis]MBB4951394.1 hypothetical protein [Kitasatospora gansuensis]
MAERRPRRLTRKILAAAVGLLVPFTPLAVGRADAATTACLSGTLAYDHQDAESGTAKPVLTQVARNANWELWGRTSSTGTVRRLASGITDSGTGRFNACYTASAPLPEAFVRFNSASTAMWRVIKSPNNQTQYTFDSAHRSNVSTTQDLGTVKVPATMQRAWHIVDTLNLLYWKRGNPTSGCWTAHQADGGCDTLTFVWDPKRTNAGYWDYQGTNYVILGTDMPDSEHLILHEAGHWFQWQLYAHDFPTVTGCNPHYIERSSSTTCAWTEGFADAVAAYTLGDYRYVFEDGSSYSFVNGPTTAGWDRGDTVQGRVGSSLLDLWSATGPDGGNWNRTIALMTANPSEDFREYFTTDRPTANPPLSTTGTAADILHRHTIDY